MIPVVGSRLRARSGTWRHTAVSSLAYQWQRGDEWGSVASFTNIAGATTSEYVIQSADENHTLRCEVKATNAFGVGVGFTPPTIVTGSRVDFDRVFGYGPGGVSGKECQISAYKAPSSGAPCVLFMHEGGFAEQPISEEPEIGSVTSTPEGGGKFSTPSEGPENRVQANKFREKGWAAFAVDWRQDSTTTGPGWLKEIPDIEAAVEFVKANAEAFNGDPSRIYLVGGSGGASLAMIVGTKLNGYKAKYIRGVASLSGLTSLGDRINELVAEIAEYEAKGEEPPSAVPNHRKHIALFSGLSSTNLAIAGWLTAHPDQRALLDSLSPAYLLGAGMPKIVAFTGEKEDPPQTPVRQGEILVERAAAVGLSSSVEFDVVPGNGHAFAYFTTALPALGAGVTVESRIDEFLRAA